MNSDAPARPLVTPPILPRRLSPAPRWLATALALGALGDVLLRGGPPGLGAFVWCSALVVLLALHRAAGGRTSHETTVAAIAVLAAAGLVLRASPVLVLVILLVLAASVAALLLARPLLSGVLAWGFALVGVGASAAAATPVGLFVRARSGEIRPRGGALRAAGVALGGLLIAAPFLFVFGALFASADPLFAKYAERIMELGLDTALSHLALAALLAWIAGGLLHAVRAFTVVDPDPSAAPLAGAGNAVAVALLLVVLLFVAFLAVQARTLFGGPGLVEATVGLSYAEYARMGFFQLVVATAIALPAILAVDWVIPPGHPRRRAAVVLAGTLLVLLLAVLASATHRLGVYLDAYGLTELRFYTLAFMAWLVVACVGCAAALLGRRERFPALAAGAATAIAFALIAVNPAARIVHYNAAHASAAVPFDAAYAASLGADAVPALMDVRDELPAAPRCELARELLERRSDRTVDDVRAWNLARWRANRAVRPMEDELRSEAAHCPEPDRPLLRREPVSPADGSR